MYRTEYFIYLTSTVKEIEEWHGQQINTSSHTFHGIRTVALNGTNCTVNENAILSGELILPYTASSPTFGGTPNHPSLLWSTFFSQGSPQREGVGS